MTDKKLIITSEQAEDVLADGERVHNFKDLAGLILGCDYDRADAIEKLRHAIQIEIGGDHCKAMKHGLVVWDDERSYSFFATDAERLEKLEAEMGGGIDD